MRLVRGILKWVDWQPPTGNWSKKFGGRPSSPLALMSVLRFSFDSYACLPLFVRLPHLSGETWITQVYVCQVFAIQEQLEPRHSGRLISHAKLVKTQLDVFISMLVKGESLDAVRDKLRSLGARHVKVSILLYPPFIPLPSFTQQVSHEFALVLFKVHVSFLSRIRSLAYSWIWGSHRGFHTRVLAVHGGCTGEDRGDLGGALVATLEISSCLGHSRLLHRHQHAHWISQAASHSSGQSQIKSWSASIRVIRVFISLIRVQLSEGFISCPGSTIQVIDVIQVVHVMTLSPNH